MSLDDLKKSVAVKLEFTHGLELFFKGEKLSMPLIISQKDMRYQEKTTSGPPLQGTKCIYCVPSLGSRNALHA